MINVIFRNTVVRGFKTFTLLLAFALFCGTAKAQNYVALPDSNFVHWLKANGYNNCFLGDSIDTTCAGVLNARYIHITHVRLNDLTGIQYFKNLDSLKCDDDSTLALIPALPPRLKIFECWNNLLDSLPTLPDSLIRLSCESNHLVNLPAMPLGLKSLSCYNNQLNSLPVLPTMLRWLYCSGNLLDSLPSLLPDSLMTLWCYANRLSHLPVLPANLNSLLCSNNALHSLPALPATLRVLDCYSDQLSTLPTLPDSLNSLICHHNSLSSLPALPAALYTLNCEYNNLTGLPALPDSMFQLYIDNNPGIGCLPVLKTVWDFQFFGDNQLACVPTYGNVYNSIPPVNSLPLCNSSNTTACIIINSIPGVDPASVHIYPNPASAEVTVIVSPNSVGSIMVMEDITGREVLTAKLEPTTTQLNTSGLPSGMYLLRFKSGQNSLASYTYKLAIIR